MINLTKEQNELLSKLVEIDKRFEKTMSDGFTILNKVSSKYENPTLKMMPHHLFSLLNKSVNERVGDIEEIEVAIKDLENTINND
jgi:hypothetical protein